MSKPMSRQQSFMRYQGGAPKRKQIQTQTDYDSIIFEVK